MPLSNAEWKVMHALWARYPASVRDLWEQLEAETGWAYSTVKTILTRLVEKGVLNVRKRANASLYTPLVTRKQARVAALHGLLDKAFDGAFGSLFQHLAADEKLSKRDRARLRALLAEIEDET